MFPVLAVRMSGLNKEEAYVVKMVFPLASQHKLKYKHFQWVEVHKTKNKDSLCEYEHPDSPQSGSNWMDNIIAFKHVKLTSYRTISSNEKVKTNFINFF